MVSDEALALNSYELLAHAKVEKQKFLHVSSRKPIKLIQLITMPLVAYQYLFFGVGWLLRHPMLRY
jgi:hypothetical protein